MMSTPGESPREWRAQKCPVRPFMKHKYVRLCSIAATLLVPPAFAQSPVVLEPPLDWQVIRRNAQEWTEVKVAGKVAPWLEKQTGKPASKK